MDADSLFYGLWRCVIALWPLGGSGGAAQAIVLWVGRLYRGLCLDGSGGRHQPFDRGAHFAGLWRGRPDGRAKGRDPQYAHRVSRDAPDGDGHAGDFCLSHACPIGWQQDYRLW